MSLIVVIAHYCSFAGIALAAIIALRQQNTLRWVLELERSDDRQDREIAAFLETRHKRYFLGLTRKQLGVFWCALALAFFGQTVFTLDATAKYMTAPAEMRETLAAAPANM